MTENQWRTTLETEYIVVPYAKNKNKVHVFTPQASGERDKYLGTYDRHNLNGGAASDAARQYFAEHPVNPPHPLADAKVGEWWAIAWENGSVGVYRIRELDNPTRWHVKSARKVYVIPAVEADAHVEGLRDVGFHTERVQCEKMLGLAL